MANFSGIVVVRYPQALVSKKMLTHQHHCASLHSPFSIMESFACLKIPARSPPHTKKVVPLWLFHPCQKHTEMRGSHDQERKGNFLPPLS